MLFAAFSFSGQCCLQCTILAVSVVCCGQFKKSVLFAVYSFQSVLFAVYYFSGQCCLQYTVLEVSVVCSVQF